VDTRKNYTCIRSAFGQCTGSAVSLLFLRKSVDEYDSGPPLEIASETPFRDHLCGSGASRAKHLVPLRLRAYDIFFPNDQNKSCVSFAFLEMDSLVGDAHSELEKILPYACNGNLSQRNLITLEIFLYSSRIARALYRACAPAR